MSLAESLPRWNMASIFPSLESPEFAAAFQRAKEEVQELVPLFNSHQVRRRERPEVELTEIHSFEAVTGRLNVLLQDLHTLSSYIAAFVATDAANDAAQALL